MAGLAVGLGINALILYPGRSLIVDAGAVRPAEAVVVLGALVFPDGRVSMMVQDRLETAYALYAAGKAEKILITGDHGQVDYDEVNTMRRYLQRKGVPPEDIFLDHAGFDTYDSMYRARDVFQARQVIVVTQRFHLPRALWIADRLGLEAQGVAADRHWYARAGYYEFREALARLKAFTEVVLRRKPVFLGPVIPIHGDGRLTHDQPR
ncbi:MAG: SanA/YdcF family protein [Bacillota bacterium]